ncbi:hypothetical protein [Streptomyces sp. B93]|uniref:hypothetical protein n=1 Tax=Streptomyces sp. B93 TaxID=2824875 RepID=UPI001B390133|nr:hypothetical protein [Streptomyces sp. B93]MBQ1094408.1 hypothetical protein [Streptomyces sp. B93]
MAASAHLLLDALSKRPAEPSAEPVLPAQPEAPHVCVFSAEGPCAQAPLTSEPPLPDAEPLTSEPPLAAPDADSTRP